MSSNPKRRLMKRLFVPILGGAAACLLSLPLPSQEPFNGALLASDGHELKCHQDDYGSLIFLEEGPRQSKFESDASYDTHFNASAIVWEHNRINQPSIHIIANNTLCWEAGVVLGRHISKALKESRHRQFVAAMQLFGNHSNAEIRVQGTVFSDLAKAINISGLAKSVHISGSRFSDIVNTCVDGEIFEQLILEDSLLDGCGMIIEPHFSHDDAKPERVLRIQNNVIRVGAKRRSAGAGRLASDRRADSNRNLALELYGNVFLVESEDAKELGVGRLLRDNLTDCADNIIVWLGSGEYPEWLPDCFSITKDDSVWQQARTSWIERHTSMAQIEEAVRQSGEPLGLHDVQGTDRIGAEAGSEAQESLREALQRDAALAEPRRSTLKAPAQDRTGRRNVGVSWSDDTLWSDGTGWEGKSRGSVVSCRKLRPKMGATVCSP